jgi:hypothetical protein
VSAPRPLAALAAGLALALAGGCASPTRTVVAERVTLDSADPVRNTWCFGSDAYGRGLQDGEVRNFGAQLEYGWTAPGQLSVVGSGGEQGVIVNLGSRPEPDDFGDLSRGSAEVAALPGFDGGAHRSTPVKAGDLCLIRIDKLATAIGPHPEGATALIRLQVLECDPAGRLAFRWSLL